MITKILLQNGFINHLNLPRHEQGGVSTPDIATLVSNLAYFGYKPSKAAISAMQQTSLNSLIDFWRDLEPVLKQVKKTSVSMDSFVVYKNFPKEVLDMNATQYWQKQIQIYSGQVSAEEVAQEENSRGEVVIDKITLTVLELSDATTLDTLLQALMRKKSSWTDQDKEHAQFLIEYLSKPELDIADFGFKENAMLIFKTILEDEARRKAVSLKISDATDVIRLGVALSGGDIQAWGETKFKSFSRAIRKLMLGLLDTSKNLEQDMSMHQEVWKRFMSMLHPSDFKFDRVNLAYDKLYKNKLKTFNATIEELLKNKQVSAFEYLTYRPGEFLRKFSAVYAVFGHLAAIQFCTIIKHLSVRQLVWFKKYLVTINTRKSMMYAPKGNWARVQIQPNKWKFEQQSIDLIVAKINKEVSARIATQFPNGVVLDAKTYNIKLPSNGQDLAQYGKGTKFSIPASAKFIRTASYWQNNQHCWFDNGINFFDKDWNAVGTCCWNTNAFHDASVFSGDPMNSAELKGRACQMVDVYPDKLKMHARYGVWNILCYSNIPFNQATEVLGTMQVGDDPQTGKLYEPSRAQFVFPLKSTAKTSYLAVIDTVENSLMYLDFGLKGQVSSAASNSHVLTAQMPALMEYINAIPSVFDLFENNQATCESIEKEDGTTEYLPEIKYSDEQCPVKANKAYVLIANNEESAKFEKVSLDTILAL